jgi:tRNA nucleotidyltransferase (CCA-adding enzyme)
MEELLARVLRRIEPTEEDRKEAVSLSRRLVSSLSELLRKEGVEGEVRVEGSFARDTWLRGENDLDLFVLLPPEAGEEGLRRVVEVARGAEGQEEGEVRRAPLPAAGSRKDTGWRWSPASGWRRRRRGAQQWTEPLSTPAT